MNHLGRRDSVASSNCDSEHPRTGWHATISKMTTSIARATAPERPALRDGIHVRAFLWALTAPLRSHVRRQDAHDCRAVAASARTVPRDCQPRTPVAMLVGVARVMGLATLPDARCGIPAKERNGVTAYAVLRLAPPPDIPVLWRTLDRTGKNHQSLDWQTRRHDPDIAVRRDSQPSVQGPTLARRASVSPQCCQKPKSAALFHDAQ